MDNPWLVETGMLDSVDHPDREDMQVLASPIRLDGNRLPNRAAPLLGIDSDQLLREIGYDTEAIDTLRAKGVV